MEFDASAPSVDCDEILDSLEELFPDETAMDLDPQSDDTVSSAGSEADHEYGGLYLDDPLDAEEWRDFDEEEDQDVPTSREEMLRELEEMLDADEEAALWDIREYILSSHILTTSLPRLLQATKL